jgi:hypothetical protein
MIHRLLFNRLSCTGLNISFVAEGPTLSLLHNPSDLPSENMSSSSVGVVLGPGSEGFGRAGIPSGNRQFLNGTTPCIILSYPILSIFTLDRRYIEAQSHLYLDIISLSVSGVKTMSRAAWTSNSSPFLPPHPSTSTTIISHRTTNQLTTL